MLDGEPRRTKYQGIFCVVIAQHIDDRVVTVVGGDGQPAVIDIQVLALCGRRRDAHGIPLEAFCQRLDGSRYGRREHQRAAILRR